MKTLALLVAASLSLSFGVACGSGGSSESSTDAGQGGAGAGGTSGSGGSSASGGSGGSGGSVACPNCQQAGAECGFFTNACDETRNCGDCPNGETCGGDGVPNKCSCTPKTCAALGAECGNPSDGCSGTATCGGCQAPETCGGAGTPFKCGCTPKSCSQLGKDCGTTDDGCGGSISCGTCVAPASCGGGGTPNVCGCTPTTCAAAGVQCGSYPDGCGGTLTCAGCTGTNWCGGSGTPNQCGCTSSATAGPSSPKLGAANASIGTRQWSNPGNIVAADSSVAQISAMVGGEISQYLVASNFGFQIPSFATITGIQVEWRRGALSGVGLKDHAIRIVKGSTILATDKSAAGTWGTALSYASYGGPGDLWGSTWTAADVNSADFGAALSVRYDTAGNDWPRVDHARVTVYFTVACQ